MGPGAAPASRLCPHIQYSALYCGVAAWCCLGTLYFWVFPPWVLVVLVLVRKDGAWYSMWVSSQVVATFPPPTHPPPSPVIVVVCSPSSLALLLYLGSPSLNLLLLSSPPSSTLPHTTLANLSNSLHPPSILFRPFSSSKISAPEYQKLNQHQHHHSHLCVRRGGLLAAVAVLSRGNA